MKVEDHFADVSKMVPLGSGSNRDIENFMLTRYACYLIAQNGDSRKPEISFAQNYFAVQTRRAELIEQRLLDYERVQARAKLAETEKILSGILYERGVDSKGFAVIRSKGDKALFHIDTKLLKRKLQAPDSRPLADFLPTISIKGGANRMQRICSLLKCSPPSRSFTVQRYNYFLNWARFLELFLKLMHILNVTI